MLRQQECSRSAVRRQPEGTTGGRKPKGRRRPRQRSFLRTADARKPRSNGNLKPPDWRSPAGSAQPRRATDIPESASFPAERTIHPAVSASAIAKPHSPSSLITEKSPSPARQQQMTGAGKASDRNQRQRQKADRIARTRVHRPARTAGGRYLHRQPEEEGAPAMAQPVGAIAPASALPARSGVARIAASPIAKGCANMPPASRRKTIARQVPANPKRNPSGATPKISPVKTGSP